MWYIIVILIIIIVCYSYVTYNNLIYLNQKTDKNFRELDLFFMRRIDLLPNVINIYNSYNLERETLGKLNFLIKDNYNKMSSKEKLVLNKEINDLIDHLWEVADANIILKQNPVFLNVIKQFNIVEEAIIANKQSYNNYINKYNKKVRRFPSNVIALFLKFKQKNIYDVNENTRKIIKTDEPYKEVIKFEEKKD